MLRRSMRNFCRKKGGTKAQRGSGSWPTTSRSIDERNLPLGLCDSALFCGHLITKTQRLNLHLRNSLRCAAVRKSHRNVHVVCICRIDIEALFAKFGSRIPIGEEHSMPEFDSTLGYPGEAFSLGALLR